MRIISIKRLREFWEKHPDAEQPLRVWAGDVRHSNWHSPEEIKRNYANASFLARNRVVFNIRGNRYRIIVVVFYKGGVVYIRFIGTHKEYDRIDATIV